MYRTARGLLVALSALAIVLSGHLTADAAKSTRLLPPDPGEGSYSRDQAEDVLAQAERRLRRDTARMRAREVVGNGPATEITMTLRDLFRARSALTGADRRQADALLARPSDPGGDDLGGSAKIEYPAEGRRHWCPTNGVACIHWVVTTDPSKPNRDAISTVDANKNGQPDYVDSVYATLKHVWDYETRTLGYRAPLGDGGTPGDADNPDARLDIYLADLGSRGLYGYCAPDERAGSQRRLPGFCVLDNDFARSQYGIEPLKALQVTVAHEFFHAIQFGYDVDEDAWMMEGTATWVEDEVYDSINDNVQFLVESPLRYPRTALDYSVGLHRYGSFLFFKYAAERFRDPRVVRQFWEAADASTGRYSLQAIRAVVDARRTSWPAFFATFASWNTLPNGSYSERRSYPSPALTLNRTLSKRARSTGWKSVALPHLSSSAIRVSPQRRLRPRSRLLVEVNAPDSSHGSFAILQTRFRTGAVAHRVIALNGRGDARLLTGFNRRRIASMIVVVSNTSTTMRDCGAISTGSGPVYSCYGRGSFDNSDRFAVRVTVR